MFDFQLKQWGSLALYTSGAGWRCRPKQAPLIGRKGYRSLNCTRPWLYRCTVTFAPYFDEICGARVWARGASHLGAKKQHLSLVAGDSSSCSYWLVFVLWKHIQDIFSFSEKTFYRYSHTILGWAHLVHDFNIFYTGVWMCNMLDSLHQQMIFKICDFYDRICEPSM